MKNAFHNITGFICFIKKSLILFLFVVFFLVVFIFFVNNKCFSQNIDSEDVFYINKIPPQGIVLDKGWKFNTGDNSEWANPEFDDKSWQSINPTLDIHDLLLQIPESGICWFRLHLSVDIPLNIQLVMMIQQTGASEIYLNGKLIHTFGVLSTDPDKIQAFNPLDKPVSFSANNFSQQVLVVRYALQPNISYSSHWANKNIGLKILLNTTENAIDQYKQIHTSRDKNNIFKIGMFVILGILYSAFYLFYPKQKVILYFSLYAFLNVCIWTLFMYINNLNEIDLWFRINNLLLVMQVAGDLIMLLAIYLVLEQKTGWIYYLILVVGIISIPCGAYVYDWGWKIFGLLFTNLINFDITRVAIKSIRKNKKGAWIIAAGGIGYVIFWFVFSTPWFAFSSGYYPVAVSIYLGYDFARTNNYLKRQLYQVQVLEKEKLNQQKREAEFEKRFADLSLSALRMQINPHFIFNCLNSIKLYAIENNTEAATDYLTKFSKLIRQVLENSTNEKITLASELEVLQLYIEMESMRFKEKLKYNILVEKDLETDFITIPPLLLQPYVENAIWHGLMHKEEGGCIDISVSTKNDSILIITIKDDGIGRAKAAQLKSKTATQQKSFGMKITSERMELINMKYKTVNSVIIDDLTDNKGNPAGTLITIQIPM